MMQPSKTGPACHLKQDGRQPLAKGLVGDILQTLIEKLRDLTLLCLVSRTGIRGFEQKLFILTSQEREKLFMEKSQHGSLLPRDTLQV